MLKNIECLKYEVDARLYKEYPLHWDNIFNRAAPLAVEIGCGNGEYLVNWARSYPNLNFVGIELSLTSAVRIQLRAAKQELNNIRIIRDDVRFILRELFPDNSIQMVVMNFPDPWPKEKHRDRRVVSPTFVKTLSAVLEIGGYYELITDQKWYTEECYHMFSDTGAFYLNEIGQVESEDAKTKYGRKYIQENRQIYCLKAEKQKSKKIKRILEGDKMPHVVIGKQVNSSTIEKLARIEYKSGNKVFKVKEVFVHPNQQTFLLRTITKDHDYQQMFFILIARHIKGTIIKIDSGFQPYRTPAVMMVVQILGEILQNN
jgi:tRNA (guanine-N7-)-methyltransferase